MKCLNQHCKAEAPPVTNRIHDPEYKRTGVLPHRYKFCRPCRSKAHIYGLDMEEFGRLMALKTCAICLQDFNDKKRPVIEHNHETGEIRGLVCQSCNIFISKRLGDDWTGPVGHEDSKAYPAMVYLRLGGTQVW